MGRAVQIAALTVAVAARAGEPLPLPPVDVPLPPTEQSVSPTARRVPSSAVTTVDAAARAGEAKDTAMLLAPVPGVVVTQSGGVGQPETLSVRGAASNGVLGLLDGVPLGGPGEGVDFSTIPAAAVERLEVFRGGGARFGPGALGGVVNVVTLRPRGGARLFVSGTEGPFETSLLSLGGTGELPFGGQGLLLLHGARSKGDFGYRYQPTPEVADSAWVDAMRKNNDSLAGGGLIKWSGTLPGSTGLDVMLEGNAYGRGLAGTVENPTPDEREQGLRGLASARVSKRFDFGGEAEVLAYGRANRSTFVGGTYGAAPWQQLDSAAGAELTYRQLAFGRHGLTALLGAGGDWLEAPDAHPSWGRFSAMAMDEVLLFGGDVTVNGSVRVDQSGPFTTFSPQLGALWLLPLGFEVKANLGQAHRPPSFTELYVRQGHLVPNPDLKPERGLYADGAAALRRGIGFIEVGGFYSLYENLISYEYYPPFLARPMNFAAARVAGLEVEGRLEPLSWLSVSATYTFLSSQNLRDDPRYYLNPLPYRPAHKLHARLAIGPKWLYARGEVLYQSAQFRNRTATLTLPERAFVNVGAACELLQAPKLSLSFELKNLLDVESADLDGYPLPPRAAYLSLSLTWDVIPERKS